MTDRHQHQGHLIRVPEPVWLAAVERAATEQPGGLNSIVVGMLDMYGRHKIDVAPVNGRRSDAELAEIDADALNIAYLADEIGGNEAARRLGIGPWTVSRRRRVAEAVKVDPTRLARAEAFTADRLATAILDAFPDLTAADIDAADTNEAARSVTLGFAGMNAVPDGAWHLVADRLRELLAGGGR